MSILVGHVGCPLDPLTHECRMLDVATYSHETASNRVLLRTWQSEKTGPVRSKVTSYIIRCVMTCILHDQGYFLACCQMITSTSYSCPSLRVPSSRGCQHPVFDPDPYCTPAPSQASASSCPTSLTSTLLISRSNSAPRVTSSLAYVQTPSAEEEVGGT